MLKEYDDLKELNKAFKSNNYFICKNREDDNSMIIALNPYEMGIMKYEYDDGLYGFIFEMTRKEIEDLKDYLDMALNSK